MYGVAPVIRSSWHKLSELLPAIEQPRVEQMVAEAWDNSPYFPVPSIIDAAMALRSGLSIREIAHSEASEHENRDGGAERAVQGYVDRARVENHHAICFSPVFLVGKLQGGTWQFLRSLSPFLW